MEYLWPYILLIMIPVVLKLFMKVKEDVDQEDEREETNKCNEAPVPTVPASDLNIEEHSIEYYREHCYDSAEMYTKYFWNESVREEQQGIKDLLKDEEHLITKLLMTRKTDKAMESIERVLNYADPIRDAYAIHWYLISALRDFYSIREEDPIVYSYCLQICDYDLQNIGNYLLYDRSDIKYEYDVNGISLPISEAKIIYRSPPSIESLTRKAIILEKFGNFDEAISLCEFAIDHDIPDTNGNTFLARKERLERKKAKLQKST